MKKMKIILVSCFVLVSVFSYGQTFTLSSKNLGGQATLKEVFDGFGCTGKNISPQLSWTNAPLGTKSFAITMYDPDAPSGSGWWHWLMFDIPANVNNLNADAGNINKHLFPEKAIQSVTDFGSFGYGGPCPPIGDEAHKYIITIYALKVESLGLDKNAMPAAVGFNLWNNTIEKASIVLYYGR
ncbi:MAG: YbhB/YbcL family Raf kinase inhibitor-like protein [Bacteroidales bacterium]